MSGRTLTIAVLNGKALGRCPQARRVFKTGAPGSLTENDTILEIRPDINPKPMIYKGQCTKALELDKTTAVHLKANRRNV